MVWDWEPSFKCTKHYLGGWQHLYFRLDIIFVKGLSKHTLNTYFSGMKIDPKYMFLYAFFFICPSCSFQNSIWPKTHPFSIWPKTHPFFPQFCTPKGCTCVHCLVLKNNPNYVNFFLQGWYPTSNTSALTPLNITCRCTVFQTLD